MTRLPPFPGTTGRRDWRAAVDGMRRLLADGDDTAQVFRIMKALNVGNMQRNYARLLASAEGGRIAYERVELAPRLADPTFVAEFAPGTVGAAYRMFLETTGYSADGLVEVSKVIRTEEAAHPFAWMGRRTRDAHDLWHVLTGYKADESLGEACLVAFSFAQTRGPGWAFIATMAALQSLRVTGNTLFARAVWEGYRLGTRASWLPGEDYLALLAEPLDAARARLNIGPVAAYRRAQQALGRQAAFLSREPEPAAA